MFWSSATLTGNETGDSYVMANHEFWSSATLTGNETLFTMLKKGLCFGVVPP